MIVTDVLSPRLPPIRRRSVALIVALLALVAIPAYQAYYGAFGGSIGTASGAFGPRLLLTLERADIGKGEPLNGVLAISAPDGAEVIEPAVVRVYPSGVPMTIANSIATSQLDVPRTIPASGVVRVPFSLDVSSNPAGHYSLTAELAANISKGNVHATVRTVTTTEFTVR
jgi:hypothetical protein